MTVRTAVIPAAGLGTRFLPVTKSVPKELLPILDKPMLQYVVEEAAEAGIERVIVVTSRGKESIASYFQAQP
ncbi:MAG: UTP--glucose-1-phosphate uridylyltransferase, partial [Planctomyces sp.]|nr:UTP--glucose-1-phosphate uridylyltransferase [Planctomyces sp.]HAI09159.1 UTP--glucose-1-phosphate uridylyltransferase [Dehalococcoidia bacterium]